jgi:cytochrome c oxidase assembly protein subunit 15
MGLKFLKLHKWLCISIFELLVLGSAVRVLNAGLACPDWPLCFGDVIPDFHPQVYLEFIHRALAGVVGIGVVALNGYLLWRGSMSRSVRLLCWLSFLLLASQIILGGLTVLWQLHSKVVTAHLGIGAALFGVLVWISFAAHHESSQTDGPAKELPSTLRWWGAVLPLAIYAQVLLGGTVATNFAALVCTDFPLCHGEFIPTLHGIIGLQVIHRLGAYTLFTLIATFAVWVWRSGIAGEVRRRSHQLLALVFVQIILGIVNVVYLNPPIITVLHLATAMLMLATALRIFYMGLLTMHPKPVEAAKRTLHPAVLKAQHS